MRLILALIQLVSAIFPYVLGRISGLQKEKLKKAEAEIEAVKEKNARDFSLVTDKSAYKRVFEYLSKR